MSLTLPRTYGISGMSEDTMKNLIFDNENPNITICLLCHSQTPCRPVWNGSEIDDIDFLRFQPTIELKYTTITPFFSIFCTTLFIICCLLQYIGEHFSSPEKKITYEDLLNFKLKYLDCISNSEVRKKIYKESRDIQHILAFQQTAKNYPLVQTIRPSDSGEFLNIDYFCNDPDNSTPCLLCFTVHVNINLSNLLTLRK